MNFLELPWEILSQTKNSLYDYHILESVRLPAPVISVGNLSMGGTGKTPFVIDLLGRLKVSFEKRAVVSRNYRALVRGPAELLLEHDNPAIYFGDEPALIKEMHPDVKVYVGPQKYKTALKAWAESRFDLLILDDGFQHRKLHRDLDIVLIDARESLSPSYPPLGYYREKFSALSRAHIVILTHSKSVEPKKLADLRSLIPKDLIIAEMHASLEGISPKSSGPFAAFAGIAKPKTFFDDLRRQSEINLGQTWAFEDHTEYGVQQLRPIEEWITKNPSGEVFTTAKDWIKLKAWICKYPIVKKVSQRIVWESGYDEVLRRISLLTT